MSVSLAATLDDPGLLRRLVDISATLGTILDPDAVLRYILGAAAEMLGCEKVSILLYNPKRGDLSFKAALDPVADTMAEISVPLDGSIAGYIFRTGESVKIDDVANDPRHFGAVGKKTAFTPRSLAGVPMRRGVQKIGVLEALNKIQGGFRDTDMRVLEVIAAQAAVAIQNAQLVQDLQHAHAEVSRVDKIKSDFMAMASHELRTPLAVIMNYAEFLKQDTTGTLSRHATRVLEASLRQREIIESMTNINRLQLGAVDLKLAPMSMTRMLAEVWKEMKPQADAKRQDLDVELPPEPARVNGDVDRLPLVFKNVVHNAIRFTPNGGKITINLSTTTDEAQATVRDNGPGVPPGELVNIFKDFYQVEDHMTRRHGGLGLGLSIARGIAQLHGGRIWAESAGLNQGTAVHVVLPRCKS